MFAGEFVLKPNSVCDGQYNATNRNQNKAFCCFSAFVFMRSLLEM